MSKKTFFMDGFERDEKGNFYVVPIKIPDFMKSDPANAKTNDQRPRSARKFIPIEPFVFPPDFGISPEPDRKKCKIEKPVRKELFKPPNKPSAEKRLSNIRRSVRRLSNTKTNGSNSKSTTSRASFLPSANKSHLIATDKTEKTDDNTGTIKKQVKTVLFPMITISEATETSIDPESTPEKAKCAKKSSSSTDSLQSEIEFLELEKKLAMSNKENYPESPLSSMCSLLQNTNINRSGGKLHSNSNKTIEEFKVLLKKDHEQLQLLKKQVDIYEIQHQHLLDKIGDFFNNSCDFSKNTENRRSNRIALRDSPKKQKFVVSPVITKATDLRKTTLNKNLTRNLDMEIRSPRMRRAVNMYNNFRNDCNVLCTPKTDRSNIDITQTSVTRSLSRRVQKQCLMLQDTPRH